MGDLFCVALFLAAASISGVESEVVVRRFHPLAAVKSAWDGQQPRETSAGSNAFFCGAAMRAGLGHAAFAYDPDAGTCTRSYGTCVRAGEDPSSAPGTKIQISDIITSYLGCYVDNDADRTLASAYALFPDDNTPSLCADHCLRLGHPYSGVEYSVECRCASVAPAPDRLSGENKLECSDPCPGGDEGLGRTCGGALRIGVYFTERAKTPYYPVSVADKSAWILSSTEMGAGVSLSSLSDGAMSPDFASADTVIHPWIQIEMPSPQLVKGLKLSYKSVARHSRYAVRVGGQPATDDGSSSSNNSPDGSTMLCSNRLCFTTGDDTQHDKEFDCSHPLKGRFVTVQKYGHQANPNSPVKLIYSLKMKEVELVLYCGDGPIVANQGGCDVSRVEPEDACSDPEPVPGGTVYLGCFNWNDGAGTDSMSRGQMATAVENTNLRCAHACVVWGSQYSGTDYERCFCSASAPAVSTFREDEGHCNKPCNGDSGQICGGGYALSVHHTTPIPDLQYLGCYLPASETTVYTGGGNYNRYCAGLCALKGFSYSATQGAGGDVCSCSHSAPSTGALASSDSECDADCPQESPVAGEKCGADSRLSYYHLHTVEWLQEVDKSDWTATGSAPVTGKDLSFAFDGSPGGVDDYFMTNSGEMPWMQLDFGESVVVHAVQLVGRRIVGQTEDNRDLEIRVGDEDAAASSVPDKRFCVNRLCYTTGASLDTFKVFSCSPRPLSGRFLTVQQYRQHWRTSTEEWLVAFYLSEIYVYTKQ